MQTSRQIAESSASGRRRPQPAAYSLTVKRKTYNRNKYSCKATTALSFRGVSDLPQCRGPTGYKPPWLPASLLQLFLRPWASSRRGSSWGHRPPRSHEVKGTRPPPLRLEDAAELRVHGQHREGHRPPHIRRAPGHPQLQSLAIPKGHRPPSECFRPSVEP